MFFFCSTRVWFFQVSPASTGIKLLIRFLELFHWKERKSTFHFFFHSLSISRSRENGDDTDSERMKRSKLEGEVEDATQVSLKRSQK